MAQATTAIALATLLPVRASVSEAESAHEWLADKAVLHYGDSVPAEYSDTEEQR